MRKIYPDIYPDIRLVYTDIYTVIMSVYHKGLTRMSLKSSPISSVKSQLAHRSKAN